MPLPILIPIAIASLSGTFGIGKSVKAAIDVKKANKTNKDANDLIEKANEKLGFSQKIVKQDLENLGQKKAEILDEEINRFILSFEKLTNVEIDNLNELGDKMNYKVDKVSLDEMKKLGGLGTSILSGVAGGTLGGALTAFGAAVAAQTFAKASTGVLISTLSGAAAKNATLAFFGGGSIAAGGGGIAVGTAVLGGLIAGPALAISGIIVGAKAKAEKEKALSNLAIAKDYASKVDLACMLCNEISVRCNRFISLLTVLQNRVSKCIDIMEKPY